jgi:type I restriction enzyme, S subunit
MSFAPYKRFKRSGADWLGRIPEHWSTARIKALFQIRKRIAGELGHDVLSVTQQGLKIRDINSNDGQLSMDYSKYQLVEPGDFVMNHMDLLTGYVDVSKFHGVTSPDYRVFTARQTGLSLRYFLYLFQNGYQRRIFYAFGQGASGLGRWRMPTDSFNDFILPVPPLFEQAAIASFLDGETAKIDVLVEEQQHLIKLLQEKRQAVISHAVTKGLDAKAPMKDSGIEWLGAVPAHWEIVALKHLVSQPIIDGPHESPIKRDEGIPFVSAESISQGSIDFEKKWGFISPEDHAEYSKRYKPQRGDILLVKLGATTGTPAIVDTDREFNIWVPLAAIRLEAEIEPLFILYVLQSNNLKIAYELNWTFGTQQTLGLRTISNLRIPIPPKEERHLIVKHLDSTIPLLASLIAGAQRAICLLQERRAALISAAVTGKIDVCGLVEADAPVPDVVAA